MTYGDRILIAVLLIISSVALISVNFFVFSSDVSAVVIEVDGKTYAHYSVNELSNRKNVSVDTEFGSNLVLIDNGEVYVAESDCPDKLEIKAGKINRSGQQLVCLPHRLVIRLEGSSSDVDGVTY